MANVKLSLQGTTQQSFPHGTVFSGYIFSIPGYPNQVVLNAPYEVDFLDVAPGDYFVSVHAIDANQGVLGAVFTEPLNIPHPDVIIAVPAAVSALVVTVTP